MLLWLQEERNLNNNHLNSSHGIDKRGEIKELLKSMGEMKESLTVKEIDSEKKVCIIVSYLVVAVIMSPSH